MTSRLTKFIASLTVSRSGTAAAAAAAAENSAISASGQPVTVSHQQRQQSSLLSTPLSESPSSSSQSPPANDKSSSSSSSSSSTTTAATDKAYGAALLNEEATVSHLPNGLTVASLDRPGSGCTLGIVVNAGPRFQAGFTKGVTHLIEKMSFGPTTLYGDRKQLLAEIDECAAIFDTQSTKDATVYAMSANPQHTDRVVQVLAQVLNHTLYSEQELLLAKDRVRYQWEEMEMSPSPELILTDYMYSAAYQANTLGYPKYCPLENVDRIDRSEIMRYLSTYYRPERMILCAIGIPHQLLMQSAEAHFNAKPYWLAGDGLKSGKPDSSVAQYTGGHLMVEKEHSEMHTALQLPELIHIGIGLESCSAEDGDFVASCVLNMMMGGGGSFSAGGPGKGMYTRLFTRVLNQYYWVNSAQAYNQAFTDTGLFCIQGSAQPEKCHDLCQVIVRELHAMCNRLPNDEVQRAKKQLESMLLMNLESRPVVFEDTGRQILATGRRRPPGYWIDQIHSITENGLRDLAKRMLQSRPTYVAYGPRLQKEAPQYQQIMEWISNGLGNNSAASIFASVK